MMMMMHWTPCLTMDCSQVNLHQDQVIGVFIAFNNLPALLFSAHVASKYITW